MVIKRSNRAENKIIDHREDMEEDKARLNDEPRSGKIQPVIIDPYVV